MGWAATSGVRVFGPTGRDQSFFPGGNPSFRMNNQTGRIGGKGGAGVGNLGTGGSATLGGGLGLGGAGSGEGKEATARDKAF